MEVKTLAAKSGQQVPKNPLENRMSRGRSSGSPNCTLHQTQFRIFKAFAAACMCKQIQNDMHATLWLQQASKRPKHAISGEGSVRVGHRQGEEAAYILFADTKLKAKLQK